MKGAGAHKEKLVARSEEDDLFSRDPSLSSRETPLFFSIRKEVSKLIN